MPNTEINFLLFKFIFYSGNDTTPASKTSKSISFIEIFYVYPLEKKSIYFIENNRWKPVSTF